MTKTRASCALYGDGWWSNPGWCYGLDKKLTSDKPCKKCKHWVGSLRDEPVNKAPLLSPDELLARRVAGMDKEPEG
jgi:hypothetical protein